MRANVRFDNIAPTLVSSTPADGTVSRRANQIVLTASEPVTAPGALLDGIAAPAPTISGSTLTFADRHALDGLHVLSGELEDASGTRTMFRVAVSIESAPSADPPPVERSITSIRRLDGDGAGRPRHGQDAARRVADPADPAGLHPGPSRRRRPAGADFAPGTQIVEVTARWAIAGTYVTQFREPIEIIFSNPSGVPSSPHGRRAAPATLAWNNIGTLEARRFRPRGPTASTATRRRDTCSLATSPSSA